MAHLYSETPSYLTVASAAEKPKSVAKRRERLLNALQKCDEDLDGCIVRFSPVAVALLGKGNKGEGRAPLDWDARMKISLGVAKGIAFRHSKGGAKFTHGNIKSTNVLLTQDLDGCVSDVGLPPLMNTPAIMSRSNGYRAPKVMDPRKITHKSDVYSFGVLLLEMLTEKCLMRYPGHNEVVDLLRWVRSVVREEWMAEMFNEQLLRGRYVEEEMVQML